MLGNGLLLGLLLILSAIGGANTKAKYCSDPVEKQRRDFYLIREKNQLRFKQQLELFNENPQIRAQRQDECARLFALFKKRTTRQKK